MNSGGGRSDISRISTGTIKSSVHNNSEDFIIEKTNSSTLRDLGIITNNKDDDEQINHWINHHSTIPQLPVVYGNGGGGPPPKTASYGKRKIEIVQPNSRCQSHITTSPNRRINQNNAIFLNQFLNQLGSIQLEKSGTDSDLNSNGGIRVDAKLGYNNPGLIMENNISPPTSNPLLPNTSSTQSRTSIENGSYKESLYFQDGIRRIDMILVYENDSDFIKEQRRNTFFQNLEIEEVDIEIEKPDLNKKLNKEPKNYFVKVHAPWSVLVKYAEIMNMKMPIKKLVPVSYNTSNNPNDTNDTETQSWWQKCFMKRSMFDYNPDRIPPEPSFYMAAFSRQKEECFIMKDRETFFTFAQRSQIVWKILTRVRCDDGVQDKNGITRLLNEKSFTTAYPLHDGPYNEENPTEEPNDRRLLFTEWAHFSNWYKRQPLGLVRRYFGDKVGLYFAWLGFYTTMLIPASIVGVLCFIYGILTTDTDYNTPSREICDEKIGGAIIMCPLCGHCNLWRLDDSCTFSKLTYYFDNPATIFFAVFMAFWATFFLEFWKRKHAVIAWEWDLHSNELEEEPRPEFEAAVKTFRINPVTQTPEPYISFWSKAVRMLVVSSVVFLLLFIMAFVVLGIVIYRLVMTSVLYSTSEDKYEFLKDNAKIITTLSAAIINLIIVVFLHDKVYYKVAIWLTNSEFPRTQTEYEDSFTFKMFLFQFINYYSYLIYVAFFKGRFFRHPGDDSDNALEKIRGDMCDPAGCLSELFIQLATIMVGKQFFDNFMELFMPKLTNWFRRRRYTNTVDSDSNTPVFLSRWEQDYHLIHVGELALFEEYLEMVIQYGFVTLFVAAFPLAPFFALLNNIIEIRLDAYKWTTQLRRPLAERAEDIGAWFGILQGLSYCSFCSNAFVIAYTSDIIPRLVYKYISDDNSLQGYINSSLSVFPTTNYSDTQRYFDNMNMSYCRYRGYYNPPNHTNAMEPSDRYWNIMAARLTFVAVFEHLAFALTGIMAFAIPDIPSEVSEQIQMERILVSEALYKNDLSKLDQHHHGGDENNDSQGMGNNIETIRELSGKNRRRRTSSIAQELIMSFNKDNNIIHNDNMNIKRIIE